MKIAFLVASLITLAVPLTARACTILSPPIATTVEEIAATGVLLKGRLVQAFDPYRETPEIIEVDTVYVGDSVPRKYTIYRPKSDFEEARRYREPRRLGDGPPIACGPFFNHKVRVGEIFDRIVLMPAPVADDPAARGRWVFHFWNGNVAREQGLDLLLEAAGRHDRLISRPPKEGSENCQQCAASNP